MKLEKKPPKWVNMSSRIDIGKIKGLIRSGWPIMQMSFRSTVWLMIGNIKEIFLPKTGMQEKQLLQDPGYATCRHCQYMHAMR